MKKVVFVSGARPNFMKIAPVMRAFDNKKEFQSILVHTGQHYDHNMSHTFFDSLGIKKPDYDLEVGSGSHAIQTAKIMMKFEEVCLKEKPQMVLVVGDVNSTIAAGLVAKKLNIELAHIEAGLRSCDRKMPEEINRIATDSITDCFFTTEKEANDNLLSEGQSKNKIHFVGHVMIDNLFYQLDQLDNVKIEDNIINLKKACGRKYACVTMHRPSNVDTKDGLEKLLKVIKKISEQVPVIFPCHPRTKKKIDEFSLNGYFSSFDKGDEEAQGIILLDPLPYNDFLYLWKDATLVLTDSGGIQEETTVLKIPCITMRENTERPITVEVGSNVLTGSDADKIYSYGIQALNGQWKQSRIPELWDGKASERIHQVVKDLLCY